MRYNRVGQNVEVMRGDVCEHDVSGNEFTVGGMDDSDNTVMDKATGTWYNINDVYMLHRA